MTLQEKLNYEFQCFFLDQMRTSKENIFAHSGEIEMKKRLLGELHLLAEKLDQDMENFLMPQHNLLESLYCYWQDVGKEKVSKDMAKMVKEWLQFLAHKDMGL